MKMVAMVALWLVSGAAAVEKPATPATPATPDSETREMLRLSGVKAQMALIGPAYMSRAERMASDFGPQKASRLKAAIGQAFDPEVLDKSVFDYCRSHYDAKQLPLVMAFLRGPLNKKVFELETQSLKDSEELQAAFEKDLKTHPPRPAREALVSRLMTATLSGPRKLAESMLRTLLSSVNTLPPPARRMSQATLDQMISQNIPSEPKLRELRRVQILYVYRTLSDEDLSRYVQFLESEPGKWMLRLTQEARVQALNEGRQRLDKLLAIP